MLLYDSPVSGNCYKVRLLLAQLGLPYERQTVDVVDRSNRPDLLGGLNPALRVPTLVLDDGRSLGESGAILWYFGEGTRVRADRSLRAGAGAAVDVLRAVRPRAGDRRRPVLARVLGPSARTFADRLEERTAAGYRALDALETAPRRIASGSSAIVHDARRHRALRVHARRRTRAASTSSRYPAIGRGSSALRREPGHVAIDA